MTKESTPQSEWERKRRRAEVFGDAEPSVTRDERSEPGESGTDESATDRWLKSQVPPHHGG